jgi:hypothetical protein
MKTFGYNDRGFWKLDIDGEMIYPDEIVTGIKSTHVEFDILHEWQKENGVTHTFRILNEYHPEDYENMQEDAKRSTLVSYDFDSPKISYGPPDEYGFSQIIPEPHDQTAIKREGPMYIVPTSCADKNEESIKNTFGIKTGPTYFLAKDQEYVDWDFSTRFTKAEKKLNKKLKSISKDYLWLFDPVKRKKHLRKEKEKKWLRVRKLHKKMKKMEAYKKELQMLRSELRKM